MTSQGSALNVIRDEQHGGVGAGGNGENDADCIGECNNWTIAADAAEEQDANMANDAARNASTTKNEVARVMHLVKKNRCEGDWGKIHNPMTRPDLDARKSTDAPAAGGLQSMADDSSGWMDLPELCPPSPSSSDNDSFNSDDNDQRRDEENDDDEYCGIY